MRLFISVPPLSSAVLSTDAAPPPCQPHQDHSQLYKHSTDKDGQLFTDEAKVSYWQQPHCACRREEGGGRGGRGLTKRAPNAQPLLVWTPTGLSAGTHLSTALNSDTNLGLYYKSELSNGAECKRNNDSSSLRSHLPPPRTPLCFPLFSSLLSTLSLSCFSSSVFIVTTAVGR